LGSAAARLAEDLVTDAMLEAGREAWREGYTTRDEDLVAIYTAMVQAAPRHPCAPYAVAGNYHAGHDWDYSGSVCLRCHRTRAQIEDNLWPGDPPPQGMSAKITTPTAAIYRCPDCNAAEGEWHKRLCLVGAEIVRAPK
jgi:hypothetical protein